MNTEQKAALEIVKCGGNVFLTGAAGCGKSYTINEIVNWARSKKKRIAVTASTGNAAYLIRGKTVHSFLGIGLAVKSAVELADKIIHTKPHIYKTLCELDILVIDEISMIDAELFDKISNVLSYVRDIKKPFGGVQMILCGDFCQLAPVKGDYCFRATEWDKASIKVIELLQVMRQDKDERFRNMLIELRWGRCTTEFYKILKSLNKPLNLNGIQPTVLYANNVNVDSINNKKYQELIDQKVKKFEYIAKYSKLKHTIDWANSLKIPNLIELCVGAQVVLTWNVSQEQGLVNGSRGVVTDLTKEGPIVRFVNGCECVIEPYTFTSEEDQRLWTSFVPLKLAYALTIHKSQGMTLDAAIIDIGKSIFTYGQAYVALSRVRSLECIQVLDIKKSSFKTHEHVIEFYKKID
jgi:ATP-dependent DNA helicase PIF1